MFCVFLIPATFFYGYYAILTILYVDLSYSRIDSLMLVPPGLINTVLSSFATLYFVPLFQYFVFLKDDKMPVLRIILLISTLSFPLLTLCYSGRDGLLYWGMNVLLFYFLFRRDLSSKQKNRTVVYMSVFSFMAAMVFMLISNARFGHNTGGVYLSLLDYLGQQSSHFSVAFHSEFLKGTTTLFPGWYELFGITKSDYDYHDFVANGMGSEYNIFGFFVKTLLCGYGVIGAVIVTLIIGFFTRKSVNKYNKTKNLISLIILVTLFQIPMNGLFYYRQGIGKGDVIYTIFLVVLLIYKHLIGNTTKSNTISSSNGERIGKLAN